MSVAPTPPPELQFAPDARPAEICERLAGYALREAEALARRRFFVTVAVALGRARARERPDEAGAELARELARHAREAWVREGIERGLSLFSACIDETGRRCVAGLVAEYFGWREPPNLFFHRIGSIFARRSAAELVRLARVTAAYARLPKPAADELRLLAAVPHRSNRSTPGRRLAIVGFRGSPWAEQMRSSTEIPSLGADELLGALSGAELCQRAEADPPEVPLVGRPLLCFPLTADHGLRRLHLLLTGAIA